VIAVVDPVEVAIRAFVSETGASEPARVDAVPRRKRYLRSSQAIHRKNFTVSAAEKVLLLEAPGVVRELTIVANAGPNLVLEVDGRDFFGRHSTYADLAEVSLYSDHVVATTYGSSYTVQVKDIHFRESVRIEVHFSSSATVSALFCLYDECKEVPA